MAKTINPQIDVYNNFDAAMKAFNKSKVGCHLLKTTVPGMKTSYFIDRSKQAIIDWPQHYALMFNKD